MKIQICRLYYLMKLLFSRFIPRTRVADLFWVKYQNFQIKGLNVFLGQKKYF